jgi:hypothetical protein
MVSHPISIALAIKVGASNVLFLFYSQFHIKIADTSFFLDNFCVGAHGYVLPLFRFVNKGFDYVFTGSVVLDVRVKYYRGCLCKKQQSHRESRASSIGSTASPSTPRVISTSRTSRASGRRNSYDNRNFLTHNP